MLQEAHVTEDRCRELESWLCQRLRGTIRVFGSAHPHNPEGTAGVVVILHLEPLAVTREPKATTIVRGHALSVHVHSEHGNLQVVGIYAPSAACAQEGTSASVLRRRLRNVVIADLPET